MNFSGAVNLGAGLPLTVVDPIVATASISVLFGPLRCGWKSVLIYGSAGDADDVPPHQVRFIRNSPDAASADVEINSGAIETATTMSIETRLCRLRKAIFYGLLFCSESLKLRYSTVDLSGALSEDHPL
jgi:hypothetical protein